MGQRRAVAEQRRVRCDGIRRFGRVFAPDVPLEVPDRRIVRRAAVGDPLGGRSAPHADPIDRREQRPRGIVALAARPLLEVDERDARAQQAGAEQREDRFGRRVVSDGDGPAPAHPEVGEEVTDLPGGRTEPPVVVLAVERRGAQRWRVGA
ncbi:hypothetical protein BRC94_00310 [Halobacteriales archaeon QS_5_70_17]|nr:MAG: hypothetical protein BRC94_00310 [Halobacteriales archaeon QS_5_70_17]